MSIQQQSQHKKIKRKSIWFNMRELMFLWEGELLKGITYLTLFWLFHSEWRSHEVWFDTAWVCRLAEYFRLWGGKKWNTVKIRGIWPGLLFQCLDKCISYANCLVSIASSAGSSVTDEGFLIGYLFRKFVIPFSFLWWNSVIQNW